MRKQVTDRVKSLREISELPVFKTLDVSYRQLQEWASPQRKVDFPKPERTLGRYHFYDWQEVIDWIVLWKRATSTQKGGLRNGSRKDS